MSTSSVPVLPANSTRLIGFLFPSHYTEALFIGSAGCMRPRNTLYRLQQRWLCIPERPREPRRPLKSLLEWRASFEEKYPSEEPPKENKPEPQQVKQEEKKEKTMPQTPSEDAAKAAEAISEEDVETEQQEERVKQEQRGEAAADKTAVDGGSHRSISPDISPSPSPPLQPKQNRASQDVGFWEEDKEGSDAEELSAEDIIKRNRYYDEEDSDS